MCSRVFCSAVVIVLMAAWGRADIYRWDNGQVIPGTEGVTPGPGVILDHHVLVRARLGGWQPDEAIDFTGANFEASNLTEAMLVSSTLRNTKLTGANLTGARLDLSTLTGANLTGALVAGTSFRDTTSQGFTSAQLYSTQSYAAKDLQGIGLGSNDLMGWNFRDQNVQNASFSGSALTRDQFYSTASYKAKNLHGIGLAGIDLTGWDFSGQNLRSAFLNNSTLTNLNGANITDANLSESNLANADLRGAVVTGATFAHTTSFGFTNEQMYSTASYQAKDLHGVDLRNNNLSGWQFEGLNLAAARFALSNLNGVNLRFTNLQGAFIGEYVQDCKGCGGSDLTGADLVGANAANATLYESTLLNANLTGVNLTGANITRATLTNADLSGANLSNANLLASNLLNAKLQGADLRGAVWDGPAGAILVNTILPDGSLHSPIIADQQQLTIRDDDGVPFQDPPQHYWLTERDPCPVTVYDKLTVTAFGSLQFVFGASHWNSTISFQSGIPVQLGGTLELTFSDDVQLATQSGRTIKVFDWTGVNPTGRFSVASPYAWDLSELYTSGEVTLISAVTGDINGDVIVDAIDAGILFGNWGNSGEGDLNIDGIVDAVDAGLLFEKWTGDTAAVPEPCGLTLFIGAAILTFGVRPRRSVYMNVKRAAHTNSES